MDKFVVRTQRESSNSPVKKKTETNLKQATIESLQGVVVIEDILWIKSRLKLEDQTKENIIEDLKTLNKKVPPRNVLKSTKIGHTVNKLTKHADTEVAAMAIEIVTDWKRIYEEKRDRPMIEVKSDHKTQKIRDSGRKLLSEALKTESSRIAEAIEREVFHQHKRILSSGYKRSMRTLVFTLRHQTDIRDKVLNKEIEISDLVKDYRKEGKITDFVQKPKRGTNKS